MQPLAEDLERRTLTELMFDNFGVPALYLANEAVLALAASSGCENNDGANGAPAVTGLVIDIGHDVTHVTPVYESYMIKDAVQRLEVGGEDLTGFVSLMLCSPKRKSSDEGVDAEGDGGEAEAGEAHRLYAQLPERKRLQLARTAKEEHAFVVADFDAAVRQYGAMTQEWRQVAGSITSERRVLKPRAVLQRKESGSGSDSDLGDDMGFGMDGPPSGSSSDEEGEAGGKKENGAAGGGDDADIRREYTTQLANGETLRVGLGRERFYAAELLMRPQLWQVRWTLRMDHIICCACYHPPSAAHATTRHLLIMLPPIISWFSQSKLVTDSSALTHPWPPALIVSTSPPAPCFNLLTGVPS
jgi:hypothetical protein